MKDSYDVVVIGSGFGGSIVACRLAQAGRSVCILERGRRWGNTQFPRSPSQIARDAFWDIGAERFGLVEYKAFRGMHVVQGSGVGGGSLHYFNVHVRPPTSVFDDRRWPSSVNADVLEPYFELTKEMFDAAPLTPPAGRTLPARTAVFEDACRTAGHSPQLVDIAVYTGQGRRNPHGGVQQLPCDYSCNCAIGCAPHAKNTLDLNYLPLAERHGAEIHPLHKAAKIEPLRGDRYRVSFDRLEPDAPTRVDPGSVDAETVIVSAGTLGTNELLLRCRDRHRTLRRLSQTLGHGFSGNGDLLLAGTLTDYDVDPGRGPAITAGADFSTARQQIYVEDLGYPDPMLWFIEGMLANAAPTLNLIRLGEAVSAGKSLLHYSPGSVRGGGRTRPWLRT